MLAHQVSIHIIGTIIKGLLNTIVHLLKAFQHIHFNLWMFLVGWICSISFIKEEYISIMFGINIAMTAQAAVLIILYHHAVYIAYSMAFKKTHSPPPTKM